MSPWVHDEYSDSFWDILKVKPYAQTGKRWHCSFKFVINKMFVFVLLVTTETEKLAFSYKLSLHNINIARACQFFDI